VEVMRNLRSGGGRRRLAGLPAQVAVGTGAALSTFILEDISERGARIVGGTPIAPGTAVRFDVPGTHVSGAGLVRHVQTLRTPLSILFSMGVELNTVPRAAGSRRWLGIGRRRLAPTPAPEAAHGTLAATEAGADAAQSEAYVS